MRIAVAILGLAGCRSLLGFDDVVRIDDARIDGRNDAALTDGPIDAAPDVPPGSCPSDYATITGGQPNHKYKLVATQINWPPLRDSCAANGGYLAIPNDAAELTAIQTLVSTVNNVAWVGVSDLANEGMMEDVLGNLYTALTTGSNSGQRDCAVSKNGDPALQIENCTNNHPGVCECDE